jgi:hypothetical protein
LAPRLEGKDAVRVEVTADVTLANFHKKTREGKRRKPGDGNCDGSKLRGVEIAWGGNCVG